MKPGRPAAIAALVVSIAFLTAQAWLCVRPAVTAPGPDAVYLGYPDLPTDHYAYMMYASQTARDGSLLVDNMFTTEPQQGRFMMLGLAAAGAIQGLVPLPAPVVWHTLRLLVLAALCLVIWKLCTAVFDDRRKAAVAHAFVLFSGGLDWIVRPLAREWFTGTGRPWANFLDNPWNFSVFWASTNLVWALPLTLVTLAILFEIRLSRRLERPIAAWVPYMAGLARGLMFALLWFIHPYTAIVWGVVVVVSALVPQPGQDPRRSVPALLAAAIGPGLVGLFVLWSQQDPVVAASNAQTGLWKLNYPVYLYPIVYGPMLLLPFALAWRRGSIDRPAMRWLLIWLGAGLVMTVNPLVTGAKFQVAMAIPLTMLEAAGLFAIAWPPAGAPTRGRLAVIIAIVGFSSLNSLAGLVVDVNQPAARTAATTPLAHLDQLAALDRLPAGGVLCDPYEGMLVPWKAGKPVFVGQWFLSTRYMEKAEMVRWFYSGTSTPDKFAGFLNAAGIRWVLYGPREQAYGPMPVIPGLTLKSEKNNRQIWEWKPAP